MARISALVGNEAEREAALRMSIPEADDVFVRNFLSDGRHSDRSDRLHYRESFACYRLFTDMGFRCEEALEHADAMVSTWWAFREIEAGFDLLEAVAEASENPRLRETDDPNEKYVVAFADIHAFRKRTGSYAKVRDFEKDFLESMRPYWK